MQKKLYGDLCCCLYYTNFAICVMYMMGDSNIKIYIQYFLRTPGTNESSGIHEISTYPEHQTRSLPYRSVLPPLAAAAALELSRD